MQAFFKYNEFIFIRSIAELQADVRRSYLGPLWWFLDPILYMLVFYIVFGIGLRQGDEDFVLFLLTGLVFWRWFDSTIRKCSNSLVEYRSILSQVYLPKFILPLIAFTAQGIKFIFVLLVFLLLFVITQDAVHISVEWIALLLLSQAIFTLALGSLAAGLVPFLPDLKRIIEYGLTLLFFMSGIFFAIDSADPQVYEIFMLNPIAFYIDSYRAVILNGAVPDLVHFGVLTVVSICILLASYALLLKCDRHYPKLLM